MGTLSSTRLIKLVSWNFGGLVLPVAAAAILFPWMLHNLGTERFGILTLIWALVGYCSFFDFGLGRALTQYLVAQPSASKAPVVAVALGAMGLLGLGGACVLDVAAACFWPEVLRLGSITATEARSAVVLTSFALPFVTVTSGFRGILEARLDFAWLAAQRALLGVLTFVLPWAISEWTTSLPALVLPIVALRALSAVLHRRRVARFMPDLIRFQPPILRDLRPLFQMGGWLTVSNLLSPLMVSVDRFVVAGVISASAIAYYAAPQEVVSRCLLIPSAVLGVWYPAICQALGSPDRQAATRLFANGVRLVGFAIAPLVVLLVGFPYPFLRAWLGEAFANESSGVLAILATGLALNALAHVPLAVLYAARQAHIPAILHLCELPLFVIGSFALTRGFGIAGTATAWSLRVVLDAVLLFWAASRVLRRGPALSKQEASAAA